MQCIPQSSEGNSVILPLRQHHRRVFAVLGVLLPVAFIIGDAARYPYQRRTPPVLLVRQKIGPVIYLLLVSAVPNSILLLL